MKAFVIAMDAGLPLGPECFHPLVAACVYPADLPKRAETHVYAFLDVVVPPRAIVAFYIYACIPFQIALGKEHASKEAAVTDQAGIKRKKPARRESEMPFQDVDDTREEQSAPSSGIGMQVDRHCTI